MGNVENFARSAYFEYDYRGEVVEIKTNLKILDDNQWLEREEYDGEEWWEFKTLPTRQLFPF